ncbi:MAG: nuclear transport factor 2 family protein [Acidobacteriaceae bacterium]
MRVAAYVRASATLALALAIPPVCTRGETPAAQSSAVLAPIHALFAGMAHRNPDTIKAAALPGTVFVLMRDGKPEQMTVETFAEHVARPSHVRIEERIHDPLIRVYRDLAVVWASFEFFADGKPDHCGTDLFNLVHTDGKWLIAGVADTGSKDCTPK